MPNVPTMMANLGDASTKVILVSKSSPHYQSLVAFGAIGLLYYKRDNSKDLDCDVDNDDDIAEVEL
jgi:hypothetical protein